jgi:hypothetical protein
MQTNMTKLKALFMTYANMPREDISKIARLCNDGNERISLSRQAGESVSKILENMNTDNSYVKLIKPQL